MRRAGGWILGLVVIVSMAGAGWFVLRGAFNRETVGVVYVESGKGDGPTSRALWRGAEFALQEATFRAGKFRVDLLDVVPDRRDNVPVAAWIGTSEALLYQGHQQDQPFYVSALDTHPAEPTGCYRMVPGCAQQGKAAAAWAKKSKAKQVFLLRDKPCLRSEAIASAFQSAALELGLAVEGPLDASVEHVDRILAAKVDLVFYSGEEAPYGTAYKVFTALREKGYAGTLMMGEADPEVSFLATRPSLVEGTYLVSPFAPAPAELVSAMGIVPGPHVTSGYFAMKAALEAIDRANSIATADLHRAAARLPYFDAQGRAALRPCALYAARNGVFEFVETLK